MTSRKLITHSQRPPWFRRLYLPAYLVSDAARYAGANVNTVAYWHYHEGEFGPALPGKERKRPLSYLQLVEVAFVATFRRLGVPLQRIRRAREYAAQTLNSEFPFAEYRWQTEGKHVLIELQEIERGADLGRLVVADAGGQVSWQPMIGDRFAQFDYEHGIEHGIALAWHLAGRDSPVVIDPRIAFGAPTVKGIPTWALKGRLVAGESLEEIHADFGLDVDDIRQALSFEGIRLAEAA